MQAGFKVAVGLAYTERCSLHLDLLWDFNLARGAYGRNVLKMTKKNTEHVYAVRKLVGRLRRGQAPFPATAEDDIRIAAFLCLAYYDKTAFMMAPWVQGGHLFYYLQQERRFGLERSKVYIAELILILEAMASHGFGQQDIRPLAIKLDFRGHTMYCDFDLFQSGNAMRPEEPISWQENRYLAPEGFTQSESNNCTAAWSLGAALFEMLYGIPPFCDEGPFTFKESLCSSSEICLPQQSSLSLTALDFLTCLLRKDPFGRLGSTSLAEIKSHEFFNDMDWAWLRSRERVAPFVPSPDHDPWIPEVSGKVRREKCRWFGIECDPYESQRRTSPDFKELASNLQKCGRTALETGRIIRTVELGFKVRQNDMKTVLQLLSDSAHCDFARDDYHSPALRPSFDNDFGVDLLHEADFIAPLTYAIGNWNEELVKVLPAHGANANLAFHGLETGYCCPDLDQVDDLSCGNVVQLAAALQLDEITNHLMSAGAIVDSKPLPIPGEHLCPGINRVLSQRILTRTTLAIPSAER